MNGGFDHLLTTEAGVRHSWAEDSDGTLLFKATQDVAPILERNKAMAAHNNGYTPSKDMRRVASIPVSIQYKWLTEEGWDCLSPDADCQRKLCQKLDSSEYMYLRTAEFRLGDHWRKHT